MEFGEHCRNETGPKLLMDMQGLQSAYGSGGAEIAGVEIAGVENAGVENEGVECALAGKLRDKRT